MVVIFPPVFMAFTRRTCPKCGHTQFVAKKSDKLSVTCKKCGSDIPPPAKS